MMNFFCKVKQMPSLGIFYTPPNSCEATVVTVSDEDMAAAASCDVLNALGLLSCMLSCMLDRRLWATVNV